MRETWGSKAVFIGFSIVSLFGCIMGAVGIFTMRLPEGIFIIGCSFCLFALVALWFTQPVANAEKQSMASETPVRKSQPTEVAQYEFDAAVTYDEETDVCKVSVFDNRIDVFSDGEITPLPYSDLTFVSAGQGRLIVDCANDSAPGRVEFMFVRPLAAMVLKQRLLV